MLVLQLGIGGVEGPERRQGGAEQTLLDVSRPVRVFVPPRVIRRDRRHARNIAAETGLQPFAVDLRLDEVFEEILRDLDVLRPLGISPH